MINKLYENLISLPTIIGINDEIFFINEIQKADVEDIKLNIDKYTDGFDTNFDGSQKIES